ncbi:hypothetical protein JCM9279_003952 [Rhodotorula babjevae]
MSLAASSTATSTTAAPIKIARSAHPSRSTLPVSAPPSPPPPPSPASLSPSHLSTPFHHPPRPTQLLRRATTLRSPLHQPRPKFDLESSSPLSPSGADKTLLLARLERAKSTQVLLREGQPARPLTSRELRRLRHEEAGESSSTAGASGEGGGTTGTEEVEETSAPVSLASTPSVHALEVPPAALGHVEVEHVDVEAGQIVEQQVAPPPPAGAHSLPSVTRRDTLVPSAAASRPSRTAPFPSLLSRRAQSSTHLDPAHAQATPLATRTSSSTPFGGHVLALKLAEAAAAQQSRQRAGPAPRRSASPASPAAAAGQGPSPSKATTSRKQQLGKTRSLPAAAQSAPATPWLGPSAHSRSSTAPMPPPSFVFPPDYRPHARAHTTTTTSSRASSSSISSSPQSSPLLRPAVAPSAAAGDPSALTLHFARRPDMSRKGSLGESWSRMCLRGDQGRATARGVFGSWGSAAAGAAQQGGGMVRGASDAETEEESGEGESGAEGDDEDYERARVNASELSVFASPRSSFASSFFTSPLSRSRSLSSTQEDDDGTDTRTRTPSASAPSSAASPTSSSPPKLPIPAKLGGSAGPHAPRGRWEDIVAASEPTLLPLPVLAPAPAHVQASLPPLQGQLGAASQVPRRAPAAAAGVEMKKLRAEQAARRAAALGPALVGLRGSTAGRSAGGADGDMWESSSSASEDEGASASSAAEEGVAGQDGAQAAKLSAEGRAACLISDARTSTRARSTRKSMAAVYSFGESFSSGDEHEDGELSESGRGGGGRQSSTEAPTEHTQAEDTAVEVNSGLEGDEDDQPRKKARKPAKGKQSKQKKGTGKLEILKTLPIEMLTEIFSHLYPNDLLALSMLKLPDVVTDYFTEIHYATLVFGRKCQFCMADKYVSLEPRLRIRICESCRDQQIVKLSALERTHPEVVHKLHPRAQEVVLQSRGDVLLDDLYRASVILRDFEDQDEDDYIAGSSVAPLLDLSAPPLSPRRRSLHNFSSSKPEDGGSSRSSRRLNKLIAGRWRLLQEISAHASSLAEAHHLVVLDRKQKQCALREAAYRQRELVVPLRPFYNELLKSMPRSERLFVPLYHDFLVLPSVKPLWVDNGNLSQQAWLDALDDIKDELEQFRLDLISHAHSIIREATTDPTEDPCALEDDELPADLDKFFSLATSLVCCDVGDCLRPSYTLPGWTADNDDEPDGRNAHRFCDWISPLETVLEHLHTWHNYDDLSYGYRQLDTYPQFHISLPREVADTVSALLEVLQLDPATTRGTDIQRVDKYVRKYVWVNHRPARRTFSGDRAWVQLLYAVKEEGHTLGLLDPTLYLDPPIIDMHPVRSSPKVLRLPAPRIGRSRCRSATEEKQEEAAGERLGASGEGEDGRRASA